MNTDDADLTTTPCAPDAPASVADAAPASPAPSRPAPAPRSRLAEVAGLSALMSAVLAACGGGDDSGGSGGGGMGGGTGGGSNPGIGPDSGVTPGAPTPTPPAPGPGGGTPPSPGTPAPPAPGPGGGTPSPNPGTPAPTTPAPPTQPTNITAAEASRFLLQASLSSSEADIAAVQAQGYATWLDMQMALPVGTTGWDWLMSQGYNRLDVRFNSAYADFMIWNQLITGRDSLRKRVALAWSEILVVSTNSIEGDTPSFAMAAYWDLLNRNAFGNYRQLLQEVTLNPAMGAYLNTKGNQKANPATGRVPDENYAREIMQLFSIGLYQLNPDGTLRGGTATETYGPSDVSNLARVFTGYNLDPTGHQAAVNPVSYRNPMVVTANRHSNEEANFLGASVPGGADAAARLTRALDIIANHPNVGPFIARQLIQRLVTSNPCAAYVGRVAAAFNNNGAGVRGDLRAVTKAVLLDAEARRDPSLAPPTWGKLREPMLRFVQWARTFGVTSSDNRWILYSQDGALGQSPLRSPSVFNFFRPGYVPEGTALTAPAPEFQITNENTVATYVNFMRDRIAYGYTSDNSKLAANYARELALVGDPAALVARLNLLLTGNQLMPTTVSTIRDAVATIGADSDAGKNNRVWAAILLVMCCPDYLVQK